LDGSVGGADKAATLHCPRLTGAGTVAAMAEGKDDAFAELS
jgi:hypothetical protein